MKKVSEIIRLIQNGKIDLVYVQVRYSSGKTFNVQIPVDSFIHDLNDMDLNELLVCKLQDDGYGDMALFVRIP